jgi:uncharacterized protein YcnI
MNVLLGGLSPSSGKRRLPAAFAVAVLAALATASAASAHARFSPDLSIANSLQLFSLVVPTEKEGVTTTRVVLTVPSGFSIDSFVPTPGWQRQAQSTGSGENTVVQRVTWTGGHTPTDDDSLFQFLASGSSATTYTFQVKQTYSDGSIVNWNGPESSESPAPTIELKKTFGGGGTTTTLTIVAVVLGAVGVVLGGIALFAQAGGRELA